MQHDSGADSIEGFGGYIEGWGGGRSGSWIDGGSGFIEGTRD